MSLDYEPDYGPNSNERGEAKANPSRIALWRGIKRFVIAVLLVLLGMAMEAWRTQ